MDALLAIAIGFASIVFALMLLLDIIQYVRPKDENTAAKGYNPRALVIMPCRGTDQGLCGNLKSIANQSYGNYSAVCVVDSSSDLAARYIKEAEIRMAISGYKAGRASGKVHAIIYALKRFSNYDVYVVADSDIRVDRHWLGNLIAPLSKKSVGISTMFPRFVPDGGFWAKVKLVWGLVGEGMMENRATRFAWGGSMAFRKDLIDGSALKFLEHSDYSVSDDISLTKIARSRGLGIAYVSEPQPAVDSDDSFGRFAEWSDRQTALSVLGYRRNLYYGIAFYSAELLLMVSGALLSYFVSAAFLVFFLHLIKSEAKTYARTKSSDPTIAAIVAFMPMIYLANLIAASRTRYITWRGRRYLLDRHTRPFSQ